jgi:biotin synthase
MSVEEQALCFLAGANSIFAGEQLLTTPNPEIDQDKAMFDALGLRAMMPDTTSANVPEEVRGADTETPTVVQA